jgi:hypothetical protein
MTRVLCPVHGASGMCYISSDLVDSANKLVFEKDLIVVTLHKDDAFAWNYYLSKEFALNVGFHRNAEVPLLSEFPVWIDKTRGYCSKCFTEGYSSYC